MFALAVTDDAAYHSGLHGLRGLVQRVPGQGGRKTKRLKKVAMAKINIAMMAGFSTTLMNAAGRGLWPAGSPLPFVRFIATGQAGGREDLKSGRD